MGEEAGTKLSKNGLSGDTIKGSIRTHFPTLRGESSEFLERNV
jgi:hypothetical protein